MKNALLISLIAGLLFFTNYSAAAQNPARTADEILQRSFEKLSKLKALRYAYHQEYNYASEGYLNESNAETYLEFTPVDGAIGVVFQFSNADHFETYNGSEYFYLNKKDKTIRVEPKATADGLNNKIFLQFTPLMLKNALPKVVADKTITRSFSETTTPGGEKVYVVEFALNKAFIDSGLGAIRPLTLDRKMVYRLTIRQSDYMPVEVYRGNNVNSDFNRTTYSLIDENPPRPAETSWYYSTYLNEYKYAKPPVDNLIKPGTAAPVIPLPLFPKNEITSLGQFRGKLVLLDFWIFHCGYCQESVPKLNALQQKYKDSEFKLLTVNIGDTASLINLFIDKTKPQFAILQNGDEMARLYGVTGYPTVVLIGKDGTVLYSGGFDREKLDELIAKHL